MIFFVAPYDGRPPEASPFLAASKKILSIIKSLSIEGEQIVLINSGHQCNKKKPPSFDKIRVGINLYLDVYTPSTMNRAFVGRLFNIIDANKILEEALDKYGRPDCIWLYNGYAFEMRLARIAKKKYSIRSIIEFEDWHFARKRGFNPKPLIDWFFWRLAVKFIDFGFAVNKRLAERLERFGVPTTLLPGVVTHSISNLAKRSPPFKRETITVGYFGGLSEEKGVGILLSIVKKTKPNIKFIITGRGELENQCSELSVALPDRIQYLGAVSEEELIDAISEVDLIVNAHTTNEGIFPFKVVEALASARLLISTNLPIEGYEFFGKAIQFYSGSESVLIRLIDDSRNIYQMKRPIIDEVARNVSLSYGESAISKKIKACRQSIITKKKQ